MQIDKNFHFKKKFGQNFITDTNLLNSLVNKLDIDKDTLVIEIGPGSGELTNQLSLKAGHVLAYEIDTTLQDTLNNNLRDFTNIDIKYQDFLKADVTDDIKNYNYKKLYLVANLPYYITTPIVEHIIESSIQYDLIAIMVQKEVGERLSALPKTKDYGSLTVYLNYYFDISKIMNVPRTVFTPQPNVDSVVITLKPHHKYNINDEKTFKKLVRDSFRQKRKTINNNLKGYELETVKRVLEQNGYSLNSRAEEMPVAVFCNLSNEIGEKHDV